MEEIDESHLMGAFIKMGLEISQQNKHQKYELTTVPVSTEDSDKT